MSIFSSAKGIIGRYGTDITVASGAGVKKSRAFIQPLRYNSKYYGFSEHHRAGFVRTERYLYIGQPEVELISGESVIETNTCKYIVKRSEMYRVGERNVYVWAILAPYGNVLEDEYETDTQTA